MRISKRCASSCRRRNSIAWAYFPYSDEDTSRSLCPRRKVDGRTIYNRKRRLMAIQRKISRAKNRELVGREVSVLVEGPSADTDLLWQGRMSTQAPEIDGVVLINDIEGPSTKTPGADPPPADYRNSRLRYPRHAAAGDRGLVRARVCGRDTFSAPNLISITPAIQLPAR